MVIRNDFDVALNNDNHNRLLLLPEYEHDQLPVYKEPHESPRRPQQDNEYYDYADENLVSPQTKNIFRKLGKNKLNLSPTTTQQIDEHQK